MQSHHHSSVVNFYVLPDSDLQKRLRFVFRLIEKAYDRQLTTLVITADEAQQAMIDRLLWTAKPARFIAHDSITDQDQHTNAPALITEHQYLKRLTSTPDIAIDLSYEADPLPYQKIFLVANQHNDILANARMKYQSYINVGIKPTVHKMGNPDSPGKPDDHDNNG